MRQDLVEQLAVLPQYLGGHVLVTVVSLGLGVAISLPLGVVVANCRRLRWATLAFASVVQTVPGLALLALIVAVLIGFNQLWIGWFGLSGQDKSPIRAIGFLPTVIALTLYCILPILRNTVTGIVGVDANTTEAATGLGMTARQKLFRVELPLAAPVIIAGIRTATVWTVGMATLSTLVGQPSLGDYIIQGLQTTQWFLILFGCVLAAVLAIALDQLVGLLESGVIRRSRLRVAVAVVGLLSIIVAGTAPLAVQKLRSHLGQRMRVEVGAKTFNESYILAELISLQLSGEYDVVQRKGLGSMVAFNALRASEIDCYVDYSGTIWATVMNRDEVLDAGTVLPQMTAWLEANHGIRCLGSLGFENAYALAVRREFAEQHDLGHIGDLAGVASRMSIASDPEFFGRAEWTNLREVYRLRFREQIGMQSTLMYQALNAGEVDVITAYTSDGRVAAFDLVVLEDRRRVLPPYDAVLLLSPRAAGRPGLVRRLRPLIGEIDVQTMRQANLWVDIDGLTPAAAAARLREELADADNR